MKFIGVDLGWKTGESGLCFLEWNNSHLQVMDITRRLSLAEILDWLENHVSAEEGAMIAVDAPLLIPNATGTRLCDRLTHKYFGRYHAGCYPANLGRPFAERTVRFGKNLETRGFDHAPNIEPQKIGRYQIEVFPHPAMIHLFQLSKILKYKKGNLPEKKAELEKLQYYIQTILPNLTPALDLTDFSLLTLPLSLTGKQLKAIEDQLDSLICAYIGAYWWYWGTEKNWVLGDRETGYIVVPSSDGLSSEMLSYFG
jgi:predicted RNase H-like nuclease